MNCPYSRFINRFLYIDRLPIGYIIWLPYFDKPRRLIGLNDKSATMINLRRIVIYFVDIPSKLYLLIAS